MAKKNNLTIEMPIEKDNTIIPPINPEIIATAFNKPIEEIRNVFNHINKYNIRTLPDDDNNEVYYPGKPKFDKNEENKNFINISWKKFFEYEQWKKHTWFWYIYNEKNGYLILARIEKWKICTPYARVNQYGKIEIIETEHYRNRFSEKAKKDMIKSLSLMDNFDLPSYEIVGTGNDITSAYLILRFTNLSTKEKDETTCRKYQPGITWLAYKELDNWKREIWFYNKGLATKVIVDDIEYINIQGKLQIF